MTPPIEELILISGGGWCMNDEAASHYTDIIHQMLLGLRFINATFRSCSALRISWQIHLSGHSREQTMS